MSFMTLVSHQPYQKTFEFFLLGSVQLVDSAFLIKISKDSSNRLRDFSDRSLTHPTDSQASILIDSYAVRDALSLPSPSSMVVKTSVKKNLIVLVGGVISSAVTGASNNQKNSVRSCPLRRSTWERLHVTLVHDFKLRPAAFDVHRINQTAPLKRNCLVFYCRLE